MKVAISAQGKEMSSAIDQRFGRTRYFIVVDSETGTFTLHDNSQNLNAPQGAGIQAAKNVNDFGAEAVVSGNAGPKAYAALRSAGIAIYTGAVGSVQEALEAFKAGTLNQADKANVEGHW